MNVTKDHLLGFGAIVHYYAQVETGIKLGVAETVGVSYIEMLILSEPYGTQNLRNVAKSLIKSRDEINSHQERFLQIIGDLGAFGPVRNAIAHSRWIEGKRPGSIKPTRIDIREGKPRIFGAEDDDKDWTAEDLYAAADKLADINRRMAQLLVECGTQFPTAAEDTVPNTAETSA